MFTTALVRRRRPPHPAVAALTALTLATTSQSLWAQDARALEASTAPILADAPYRTFVVDIPLESGDVAGHWIEWLVRAKAGTPLLYSWSVSGVTAPEEFYVDLFGHGVAPETGEDVSYHKQSGLFSHGSVILPYDGLHGWYFKNDSAHAVVVHLRLSGDVEVVTAAELAAIQAAEEQ